MGISNHFRLRSPAPRSVVRLAVTRFALLSFATLVILGMVTVVVSRQIARDEALRDARTRSEAIARSIAAPLVSTSTRSRDPDAMRALNSAMENRIRYGSVSHIVLWDAGGRVLWAEDKQIVGEQIGLTPELSELARRGGTLVAQPGEREPHPGRAVGEDDLLEIYVGALDADGEPFLFEAYLPAERIDQDYRAIIRGLLPMSLGMLLLLELTMLPLALSLARRIDRTNEHRSSILKRSLASWHEERRDLAQDLHDGVIQDLAAMSYALPALIDQLPDDPSADAARVTGRRMKAILVQDLTALRSMVVDLAPAELDGSGVVAALESLRSRAVAHGLEVILSVDPGLDLAAPDGGLVYRVVREGLRNVEKHAQATTVVVVVGRRGDQVEILVSDDGRGISTAPVEEGHVGLRLLAQLVQDLGGTLTMGNDPQGGASLRVLVSAPVPDLDDHL